MSHPDQLREYARDCLRLSQGMASPELKIHLINMAEAWATLASQSERIASLCATVTAEAIAAGESPHPLQGPASAPQPGTAEQAPASGRDDVRHPE
jgi:hypothetical protein